MSDIPTTVRKTSGIRTEILRMTGNRIVRKYPLTKEAEAHVRHMMEAYEKLKGRYAGKPAGR